MPQNDKQYIERMIDKEKQLIIAKVVPWIAVLSLICGIVIGNYSCNKSIRSELIKCKTENHNLNVKIKRLENNGKRVHPQKKR